VRAGSVGLERVAKARRDPALVEPVTEALEQLDAIYARLKGDISVLHASRENLLLPVDLVHEPTGTVIEVDESPHFTSFRLTALELYAADARVGFDIDEYEDLCRAWCSRTDVLARGLPPRASDSAGCSGSGPTTMRSATLQPGDGPPAGRSDRAVDGDGGAIPQRASRSRCSARRTSRTLRTRRSRTR
jgi:hypothetical protein